MIWRFRSSGLELILILQSYSESKMLVNLRSTFSDSSISFILVIGYYRVAIGTPSSSSSPISWYVIWTFDSNNVLQTKRPGKSQNKLPVGNIPQVNRLISKRWSWLSMKAASWKGLFAHTHFVNTWLYRAVKGRSLCADAWSVVTTAS